MRQEDLSSSNTSSSMSSSNISRRFSEPAASVRNEVSGSKWNPNLPDLPEVETEEKEKLGGKENLSQAKGSKWNKILPEVKAASVKDRGSIAKPGVFSSVLSRIF